MSQYYLVVEDNPSDSIITKALVESFGGVSHSCEDAFSALDLINDDSEDKIDFCAFIVDLHMPNMSGLSFIRRLRKIERYKSIPILVTSAKKESDDIKSAMVAGANDYLVKPLDPLLFEEKLSHLVGRKQSWAEYKVPADQQMSQAMKPLKMLNINEIGATVESHKEMKVNERFALISRLLLKADISVLNCKVESADKVGPLYKLKVRFLGVTESNRKKIRLLCRKLWGKNREES